MYIPELKSLLESGDIEGLRELLNPYVRGDVISFDWCTDDVREQAGDVYPDITDEQCREVLSICEKSHDCNYGMTWDLLTQCIYSVMRGDL